MTVLAVILAGVIVGLHSARPAAAAQGGLRLLVTSVMDNVTYSELGQTTARRLDRPGGDLIVISTTDLRAPSTLRCESEACSSLGLDGADVAIDQSLQIILGTVGLSGAIAGNGVVFTGNTAGDLAVTTATGSVNWSFEGSLEGSATCAGGDCDVDMAIRATTARGNSLTLNLTGIFDRQAGAWSRLEGYGQLSVAAAVGTVES